MQEIKRIYYTIYYKFIYFLAKHFGIVESEGRFCIANKVFVEHEEIEYDYDRVFQYYAIKGLQIFPVIKKVYDFPLGWCSRYRDYIRRKMK